MPTKLLLKPQATVNGFKATSQVITTTSTVHSQNSNSSIPMKVVFVNALNSNSNAQQPKQQITLNKSLQAQLQAQGSNSTFITNKLISASQQQPQKVQLVNNQLSATSLAASLSSPAQKPVNVTSSTTSHHHTSKSSKSLLGSSKLPGKRIS